MRMHAFVKGAGALVILAVSWLNQTLSPLIWVLLALVLLDIVLHIHKGLQQQMTKLWAATAAIGLPTYLAVNSKDVLAFNPEVLKIVVAALCIAYIQVVFPSVISAIGRLRLSSDPVQNAIDDAMLEKVAQTVVDKLGAAAAATVAPALPQAALEAAHIAEATTPGSGGGAA